MPVGQAMISLAIFHPKGVMRKNGTWILEYGTPKLLVKTPFWQKEIHTGFIFQQHKHRMHQ